MVERVSGVSSVARVWDNSKTRTYFGKPKAQLQKGSVPWQS